jgi:4-hydroxy-tetrahydrodipicolinate reductase
MRIAIIGYGKMGKEVEKIALKRYHEVSLKIDSLNELETNREELRFCNVAIDFSQPNAAINNILTCFEENVPIVVGTTGWYDKLAEISTICEDLEQTLFYSPNFSIGVNILFEVNKYLAKLMNRFQEYDISIEEIHHINKLDKPSGTAIFLANDIINNLERKKKWVSEAVTRNNEIPIKSIRENNIIGTHTINYISENDKISVQHEAFNRSGFALGAILAAEWAMNKKGVYTMSDFLSIK